MKKNLLLILAALVLMVLFPGLAQAVAEIVSAAVLWLSTQPLLLVFGLGLLARPYLSRTAKTKTAAPGR